MVKQSKCGTPYAADEYLNNFSYNFVITNLNLFVYLNIIGMNSLGWIFWDENSFFGMEFSSVAEFAIGCKIHWINYWKFQFEMNFHKVRSNYFFLLTTNGALKRFYFEKG